MTSPQDSSHNISDTVLASSLVTSPAWAPWLTSVNEILSTATLLIGLALGLGRLWQFFRDVR